jgi:small subunit ribosomal protein S21
LIVQVSLACHTREGGYPDEWIPAFAGMTCTVTVDKGVSILPSVELRSNESQEQLLRRFRKEVAKSKVLSEIRRRRWHVSKSEMRRIEKKKAIRRIRRKNRNRRR